MQAPRLVHFKLFPLVVAAGMFLYGCAASADSPGPKTISGGTSRATPFGGASGRPSTKPVSIESTGDTVSTLVDARPAALVDGKPLAWSDLRVSLNELAGAEALQEAVLDRRMADALASAGILITADDAAAEKKLLLESLSSEPNQAVRLLDELRDRQRLGKVRFDALMRRNAGLRALVKHKVQITEEAVQNMQEMAHGPRRQARIMVLANLETAQAALNLVNSGVNFADVAVEMSQDSSAPRGGLLEPVSRTDPAYPESIRQTMWTLNPGEISGPVMIDDRYALVMLVKRIAGDGIQLDDVRPALERAVRLQQERLLMDQLARRMLAETQVTIFDDTLHEAWTRRKRTN